MINFSIFSTDFTHNSFNCNGILCEGKGVCQSYAYAFDVLADLSGLESIMVTGTLSNGGHAWNAVKISGNWCMVDVTNNKNVVGIPEESNIVKKYKGGYKSL